MGLAVNAGKTKYMLTMSGVVPRMGSQSYNFDVVKEFIYLGTAINTHNEVSLEIKRRVTLANRCYFGFNRQLSSRPLTCDEINTPTRASLWPWDCSREKCCARFLVQ